MKETSETSFISRSQGMQEGHSDSASNGQLFLGHKLLGELKILMRLSAATNTSKDGENKTSNGQSY